MEDIARLNGRERNIVTDTQRYIRQFGLKER